MKHPVVYDIDTQEQSYTHTRTHTHKHPHINASGTCARTATQMRDKKVKYFEERKVGVKSEHGAGERECATTRDSF